MAAVALVGVAAVIVAWWVDRDRARQRSAPPTRGIPALDEASATPTYLSPEEAYRPPDRRAAEGPRPQHRADRGAAESSDPAHPADPGEAGEAVTIQAPAVATPAAPTTTAAAGTEELTLSPAHVVVVQGKLADQRLLSTLWRVAPEPLVVCADGWDPSVVQVIEVNRIQQFRTLHAVESAGNAEQICALAGCIPVAVSDLAADWLPPQACGTVHSWHLGPETSVVVPLSGKSEAPTG